MLIDKVSNAGELYFFKMLLKLDTNIAWGGATVLLDSRQKPTLEHISVDPAQLSIPAEGGEEIVSVTATGAYTLAGTHTGFEVSQSEDGIIVKAEKNSTGSDRTGTVEVRLTGTSKVAKLELFQADGK